MKKNIKYAIQRFEALRTLATASGYILRIDELKPGALVVLYARASTRQQKESLSRQIAELKAEMEKRGFKVIAVFSEYASRDEEFRSAFGRAVLAAKAHNAVIVAVNKTRLKGCFYFNKPGEPRKPAPLNVFAMRQLTDEAEGVPLATLNHPDATDDRSCEIKGGQQGKGKFGGRPMEQFPIKAKRLRLMDKAIRLREAGFSYRKAGAELGVPWSTVRDWIKRCEKSAHPASQSKSPKSPLNRDNS